jgi:hypothetical protein
MKRKNFFIALVAMLFAVSGSGYGQTPVMENNFLKIIPYKWLGASIRWWSILIMVTAAFLEIL